MLENSIKMLPKSLAGRMPILIIENEGAPCGETPAQVHAVVIDDDPLIHHVWSMAAKQRGHHYMHIKDPNTAQGEVEAVDKMTPIFVDYNLGPSHRGDVLTRCLVDAGYQTVFLMTGEDECNLPAMPWLAGVTGKEPPTSL